MRAERGGRGGRRQHAVSAARRRPGRPAPVDDDLAHPAIPAKVGPAAQGALMRGRGRQVGRKDGRPLDDHHCRQVAPGPGGGGGAAALCGRIQLALHIFQAVRVWEGEGREEEGGRVRAWAFRFGKGKVEGGGEVGGAAGGLCEEMAAVRPTHAHPAPAHHPARSDDTPATRTRGGEARRGVGAAERGRAEEQAAERWALVARRRGMERLAPGRAPRQPPSPPAQARPHTPPTHSCGSRRCCSMRSSSYSVRQLGHLAAASSAPASSSRRW